VQQGKSTKVQHKNNGEKGNLVDVEKNLKHFLARQQHQTRSTHLHWHAIGGRHALLNATQGMFKHFDRCRRGNVASLEVFRIGGTVAGVPWFCCFDGVQGCFVDLVQMVPARHCGFRFGHGCVREKEIE
jgi:hypothetical protein